MGWVVRGFHAHYQTGVRPVVSFVCLFAGALAAAFVQAGYPGWGLGAGCVAGGLVGVGLMVRVGRWWGAAARLRGEGSEEGGDAGGGDGVAAGLVDLGGDGHGGQAPGAWGDLHDEGAAADAAGAVAGVGEDGVVVGGRDGGEEGAGRVDDEALGAVLAESAEGDGCARREGGVERGGGGA